MSNTAVEAIRAGIVAYMGSSQIWDSEQQITDFAECVLDTIKADGWAILAVPNGFVGIDPDDLAWHCRVKPRS